MQIRVATSFLLGSLLYGFATAAVIGDIPFDASVVIGDITPGQVSMFAPETSACNGGSQECSTVDTVVSSLNEACSTYNLKSLGEKAGMIGYMAFESVGFQWNTNQFPGRAGQGTKCMLMFPHLYNFALSFPELKQQVINLSPGGAQATPTFDNYATIFTPEQLNAIRALVLLDKYTFKSAPWFITSYSGATCDKSQLNNGYDGFTQTMASPCIGVTMDDGRKARWCTAIKALLPQRMAAPDVCNF